MCILQGSGSGRQGLGSGRQGQRGRKKQPKTKVVQLALTELPGQLHAKPSSQLPLSNPPRAAPELGTVAVTPTGGRQGDRREQAVSSTGDC